MKENKKKLGKNSGMEISEGHVEQVAGGWGIDSIKSGFDYITGAVNSAADAVNGVVKTGSDLVGAVQNGVDTVTDAGRQAVSDVTNTAKGF